MKFQGIQANFFKKSFIKDFKLNQLKRSNLGTYNSSSMVDEEFSLYNERSKSYINRLRLKDRRLKHSFLLKSVHIKIKFYNAHL